jgi:hypothetical protein
MMMVLGGGYCDTSAAQEMPSLKTLSAPFQDRVKPKVMILGVFHFNDGGNDAYKPKYSVNIKSPERQAEVKELLELLVKFKPTRVAIESMPSRQKFHDSLYTEFINHRYVPGENEIYQLGYRLAAMLGHRKLYNIDAPARGFDDAIDTVSFAKANHQDIYLDSTYLKLFFNLYAIEDSLKSVLPLRTSLAYQNDPERLRLGLGHYLTGDFKIAADGYYPGADGSTYWWNRNLRIFSNILRLAAESKEERVFVMIGAGHLPILRFLALACPDIEFVDVCNYLVQGHKNN